LHYTGEHSMSWKFSPSQGFRGGWSVEQAEIIEWSEEASEEAKSGEAPERERERHSEFWGFVECCAERREAEMRRENRERR
jgi:xanthine/CO dehydrogenase XdhC/CoxF family maturation factor